MNFKRGVNMSPERKRYYEMHILKQIGMNTSRVAEDIGLPPSSFATMVRRGKLSSRRRREVEASLSRRGKKLREVIGGHAPMTRKLRKVQKEVGLKLSVVAREVGVSQQALSFYLDDDKVPESRQESILSFLEFAATQMLHFKFKD